MKTDDLKAKGLTDEQIAFVMAENGKDITKYQKENEKLKADSEKYAEQAREAEETLKKFEGMKPEDMEQLQKDLDAWKQKAEEAEKDYQSKLLERDFADVLKTEMDKIKFTSEAAKTAVLSEITSANLTLKDGKILGLSDLVEQIKERDASAFVDESKTALEESKAKFTQQMGGAPASGVTKESILAIKDKTERINAIARHKELFVQ